MTETNPELRTPSPSPGDKTPGLVPDGENPQHNQHDDEQEQHPSPEQPPSPLNSNLSGPRQGQKTLPKPDAAGKKIPAAQRKRQTAARKRESRPATGVPGAGVKKRKYKYKAGSRSF